MFFCIFVIFIYSIFFSSLSISFYTYYGNSSSSIHLFLSQQADEEIGMTNERQAEFRGKLFSMLGDRGQAQASASSSSSKDKEASLKRKEDSSGSDSLRVSIANVRTNSTESGTGSDGSLGIGRDRVQSPLGGLYSERGVEGDGWICPSCTLTNSTVSRRCTTCEAVRSN